MDFIAQINTPGFAAALATIVLLDLVLAGDNAIVIGLAARNVPEHMQRRVIFWGMAGAIGTRALLTLVVVWLLRIPGFLLAGGLALVWIAWRLAQDDAGPGGHSVEARTSVRAAIGTIVVADAVMGVDNVLAIGGAAQGSALLVVLGLVISIPIVIWGSRLILRVAARFPAIVIVGAGVLGWTAAKMIASEALLADLWHGAPTLRLLLYALVVGAVTLPALWHRARASDRRLGVALTLLLAWCTAFEVIEQALGWDDASPADWRWWHEGIDLVMWVGWIPLAVALLRRFDPQSRRTPGSRRTRARRRRRSRLPETRLARGTRGVGRSRPAWRPGSAAPRRSGPSGSRPSAAPRPVSRPPRSGGVALAPAACASPRSSSKLPGCRRQKNGSALRPGRWRTPGRDVSRAVTRAVLLANPRGPTTRRHGFAGKSAPGSGRRDRTWLVLVCGGDRWVSPPSTRVDLRSSKNSRRGSGKRKARSASDARRVNDATRTGARSRADAIGMPLRRSCAASGYEAGRRRHRAAARSRARRCADAGRRARDRSDWPCPAA
jgi:YjbE family integral membrane protein